MRKLPISIVMAALALLLWGAAAAEYPDKPVSFVVPFPPGDLEDVLTRIIVEDFQSTYGTPAAVINKPGGGGGPFPGAMEVAVAPPDGSTIGSFVIDVPVIGPTLGIDGLNADTFEPVGIFLTYPFVLVTRGDAPYGSMEELAAYAKDNDVALGHFGPFLIPTNVTFAAAKELGFEFASEAAFDSLDCNTLAAGDADVINTTIQTVLPCLDDVKVLVAITEGRISKAPDAPTMVEVVPSLNISLWNGLFVPKGTPQEVKDKIAAVAKAAMEGERGQAVAAETSALVYWKDAAASASQISADIETTARIESMISE